MNKSFKLGILLSVTGTSLLTVNISAQAAPTVFFDDMFTGAASFDSTVTGVGGQLSIDTWTNLPSGQTMIDRGPYSIRKVDGSIISAGPYNLSNSNPLTSTSGDMVTINPSSTDVNLSRQSGIEFMFDNDVNGLGFEVGDWATCCQPSNLYISFDNGAPILVGESLVFGDQFLTNGGAGVFVGAIDDSGFFSTVQFWGDGAGEFLNAGGEIRFATVDQGSLPNPNPSVPEPTSIIGLLTLGLFGLGKAVKKESK